MEEPVDQDGQADSPLCPKTCGHEAEDPNVEFGEYKEEERVTGTMASWIGTPAVKGSTESMRMALLTFSLIGLQCVPSSYSQIPGTD